MRTRKLRSYVVVALCAWSCGSDPVSAGTQNPPPGTPPPPNAPSDLVMYTTLDGPSAVMSPASGSGTGITIETLPSNDFVAARYGSGLRTNAIAERILIPQTDGQTQNVELERGTIEFWYRPNYDHNNNLKYTIVGTGNWHGMNASSGVGSLHLGKHNLSNQNMIFLIFYDANAVRWEHNVVASAYGWKAGDWLLMRLTWDFNVAPGVQNLHLYINGAELPLTGEVSRGPQPIPAERSSERMYIGARDVQGGIIADGIYDEFKVWNRVIPPS